MYISFVDGKYELTSKEEEISFEIENEKALQNVDVDFCEKLSKKALTTDIRRSKDAYILAIEAHLADVGVIASSDVMENIKRYIDEHLNEKITVEMLSEMFFLSRYYLIRRFKKTFGITPIKYHEQKKTDKAKELLKYTDMPIKRIGETLGYFDDIYFARVFRKNCGISPSEYRKQERAK